MTKKFWKDNRGQMIYAVVVAVMFLSVLSMIAMGLSLQHYHAAVQKQENIANYYKADAAVEIIRIELMKAESAAAEEPAPTEAAEENGENAENEQSPLLAEDTKNKIQSDWGVTISNLTKTDGVYTYTVSCGNVAVTVSMKNNEFTSWEVSYNASND
ncbi:MAG: hypothetical protein IJW70_02880 [Clostridia bacterium]|nr:hypothetical protein [Clostridia bacterium]